jgi:CheY-like chemotaxis protein
MHSRPGRGTFFRVVLPAVDVPAVAPSPAAGPPSAPRRGPAPVLPARVLLLDDELEIREAMTGLLRSHSVDAHAVDTEEAAAEALHRAAAEGRPFDLLLCDYRLADGANGLDAGLRLSQGGAADAGRGATPLLLITGETSPDRLLRVRESRVPVLFKPVAAESLLRAMADATPAD